MRGKKEGYVMSYMGPTDLAIIHTLIPGRPTCSY